MDGTGIRHEIVLVNDGSTDDTLAAMTDLADTRPELTIVNLTRNFGKEIALTAGLRARQGDAVVVLDADLQDPPELIPDLRRAGTAKATTWSTAGGSTARARPGSRRSPPALFYRAMSGVGPVAAAEERRRLPADQPPGERGAPQPAGAPPLHEGPVRLGGLPRGRHRLRPPAPLRRQDQVELLPSFSACRSRRSPPSPSCRSGWSPSSASSWRRSRSSTAAIVPGPDADLRRLRRRLSDPVPDHADARRRRS